MIEINDDINKSKKTNSNYYYNALIPFISLIISILIYVIDRGPTVPPFTSETESIDCHSLSYENYSIHDGVIDFYVHQSDTINFPPEYVPHFISVYTVNNENISMEFNKAHLKNMSLVNNTVKFTLAYPISSEIIIFLKCLNKDFAQQRVILEEVNETDDETFSTKGYSGENLAKMTNVCFENTKFLFFNRVPGYSETIPFNQSRMRFEIIKLYLQAYLRLKNVSRTNETSFLIPPFDPVPWKSILFNLLPISLSLDSINETQTKKFHFLFRDMPTKGSTDIIKRFSIIPPAKIKDIQCFKKILLPKSYSKFEPTTESIQSALTKNFTYLRSTFPRTGIQNKRIVLAGNLQNRLETVIHEVCEDCEISILKKGADVITAADLVHSAQIFVGNHLFNLLNMVWLIPNRTALIDVTPPRYSCAKWAEVFSNLNNLSYFRVNELDQNCNCYDFECYPQSIFEENDSIIDLDSFRKKLKVALEVTEFEVDKKPEPSPSAADNIEKNALLGKYRFV